MEWILTFPNAFSLAQLIRRSRWLLLPPFEAYRSPERLTRVELLGSGRTVALTLAPDPAGLILSTETRLMGMEAEELSRKIWRALRLGENLTPFLELAATHPVLRSALRQGARFLRGTSLFEDVVKALLLASSPSPAQSGPRKVIWLVERLGHPLASNPTRHAFPTPHQVLQSSTLLSELGPDLAPALVRVAELFQHEPESLEGLADSQLPLRTLVDMLDHLFGLNECACSLVMLCLGRYDYIPTDECALRRVSLEWPSGHPVGPAEVRAAFEHWQPWGGLAYWLWNWPPTYPCEPWEGELQYGKDFAN